MSGHEEPDARAVLKLLRDTARAATDLGAIEGGFDPVTRTLDFPEGPLTVTIASEHGEVTVAFYDPAAENTVVMTLAQLRRRLDDL